MQTSDRKCIEGCLDGRPDDYRLLVSRYEGPLRAVVAPLLRDRGLLDEVVQESFVRGFVSLRRLERPESFFAWLVGIALRVTRETQRNRTARTAPDVRRLAGVARAAGQGSLDASAADAEAPDRSGEHDPRLAQAVQGLPESYRNVILLRYYAGMSCVEIGEVLDMPLGSVTKQLSRAYGLLRASLA